METQNLFAKLQGTFQSNPVAIWLCNCTVAFNAPTCDLQNQKDARRKHISDLGAWGQKDDLCAPPITAKLEAADPLGIRKACR
jgi:hypothetical protein